MKKLRVLLLTLALAVGLAAAAFAAEGNDHPILMRPIDMPPIPTEWAPYTFSVECGYRGCTEPRVITIDAVRAVKTVMDLPRFSMQNSGHKEYEVTLVLTREDSFVHFEEVCPACGNWRPEALADGYHMMDGWDSYIFADGWIYNNALAFHAHEPQYPVLKLLKVGEDRYPEVVMGDVKYYGDAVPVEPEPSAEPEKPAIPATGTAYALEQTAVLDGKEVAFDTYALKDANGNGTNYMKIRDLAYVLNGSKAQFALGYDAGSISFNSKAPYSPNGTEMTVPFSGDQTYSVTPGTFRVDGREVKMTTVSILDAAGNGYTYIKVRDLAEALNFYVGWNGKIVIDTGRPYEA